MKQETNARFCRRSHGKRYYCDQAASLTIVKLFPPSREYPGEQEAAAALPLEGIPGRRLWLRRRTAHAKGMQPSWTKPLTAGVCVIIAGVLYSASPRNALADQIGSDSAMTPAKTNSAPLYVPKSVPKER
ncbi:hypothetical protein L209DRAFT_292491 [Thermothelomyces heterothallicus CBS 203.75]